MAEVFYDTNIFLYAAMNMIAEGDLAKQDAARDLLAAQPDFAVSGQVMQEFYANSVRKGAPPLTDEEIDEWLSFFKQMEFVPIDALLVTEAVGYSRRYKINYWDGAIVAAAHAGGAQTLYTEDLNHGQTYGSVTALNPFVEIAA